MDKSKHAEDNSNQEAEREIGLKESRNFKNVFKRYTDSITALREFFSRLSPFVTKLEKGIRREQKASINKIAQDFGKHASKKELDELMSFLESLRGKSAKKNKKVGTPKNLKITSPLAQESAINLLRTIFFSTPSAIHRELLNRSILMSLVSYFEVLVADLAHAFYRIAPDAISTDNKVLSVNELKQFNTIDEALRSIVSDRIDKLLRGSVRDWRDFFQSHMNIDMELLTPDWARWNECFQRRHVMVHAGGRASETYLSHVDWEAIAPYMTKPNVGNKLDVETDYLKDAINTFEITGILLCQEVWRKLVPGDEETRYSAFTGIENAIYESLLSHHWYVAEKLAAWGEKDGEASEDSVLMCKFNRWLCIKREERWAEVEEEVKAFDCSAKHRRFALARASLPENADEFFKLLPKALAAEDINIKNLKEWPILDEIRGDPRFSKVIDETKQ